MKYSHAMFAISHRQFKSINATLLEAIKLLWKKCNQHSRSS